MLRDSQEEVLLGKVVGHGVELRQAVKCCEGDKRVLVAMDMDKGNLDGQATEKAMTGPE